MNDFTKEELHWIRYSLGYFDGEFNENLNNKVKSMIDNYCEHDWRKGVHLFNDVYCTKCKLHFEVNNEE